MMYTVYILSVLPYTTRYESKLFRYLSQIGMVHMNYQQYVKMPDLGKGVSVVVKY